MLKKTFSLLVAVCMLFCLSACGTTETDHDVTDTPSKSQADKPSGTDETTSTQSESRPVSSTTKESETNNISQTQPSINQPKPTSTTTHNHKYADATCTTPKKCSCGATEGSALGHKYQNGVCSVCNAIDEVKYVEAQVNAADKAFTDYTKYNDALKIIKAALQKFPKNTTLKTKKDYYQSFAPLYLSDIEPYSKTTWFKSVDEDKDVFNTTHYHCIRIEPYFQFADGTYDLSAKYNTFTATVYSTGNEDSLGWLKIYADGECVYSNTSIEACARPFKITLDVTGVMDLKIEMSQDCSGCVSAFGLSDVYIQKTVK